MTSETCAKGREPEGWSGVPCEGTLQREEHRRTAHVAALLENLMGLSHFVLRQPRVNGSEHVATTGMTDNVV